MSPTRSDTTWPGCHGVRLSGDAVDVGMCSGEPLAYATASFGDVAPADGVRLWSQAGEAAALYRRDDGRLVLTGPTAPALEVDPRTTTITIAPGEPAVQRQLVASFGVPLLLHDLGVLLVHGSACARGDAVVVCADSGSGKSSMLVRLVDDGWFSLSEDLCTLDLRSGQPRVWPGPPWVRVAHGEPGPRGATRAFESSDKTAWDVSARQAPTAVRVGRVVLLDPPGGDETLTEMLPVSAALRALARHAVWLEDPDERGQQLFGPVAEFVTKVPAFRVRLPRREGWRDTVPALLGSDAFAT